ncbi:carboxypeptidase-like regulatory domain-containing protein [uncultured Lacinutrix sp.]|uniref:carboxypeptidase-like regulatory domain-containing protein n=1 Tax=uncultured Lacinutrix sp. TaxID=574032 RepID=UPI00260D843E|nr:carboxypeptidase-like regulatory domain-containing protein [uncultured Lacinutrix sp.]
MKLRLLIFITYFSLVSTNVIIAQENKEILGQIINEVTQEGVVYATVSIKGKDKGVVADEDGYFRLPYIYKASNDVLIISSIGYATLEIEVNTLEDNIVNIIGLESKTESLDNVVIQGSKKKKEFIPARKIVDRAIKKINDNYPKIPHSYIAYYRDYQILNKKFFNLNEGIMEVFDAGFHTNALLYKDNQTVLCDFKSNLEFPRDSLLAIAYSEKGQKFIKGATIGGSGGNELSILNIHNVIRNYAKQSFSFIDVFKQNFLLNHEFRLSKKLYLNDEPIYEIKFFAKEKVTGVKNTADGIIYINYNTFAIHKLEYYGYEANDLSPFYSVKIEYKPKGDKMYLNYISFNNRFDVKSEDNFKIDDVTFDKSENAFFVTFNNKLNKKTIENKKNFRFIYKKKKLKINKITATKDNIVKITLVKGTLKNGGDFDEDSMKDLTYKIKRVQDAVGRKLGKVTYVKANQYRELFVQEVFESKQRPSTEHVVFVNKRDVLSESIINENFTDASAYWINTPLKSTKD